MVVELGILYETRNYEPALGKFAQFLFVWFVHGKYSVAAYIRTTMHTKMTPRERVDIYLFSTEIRARRHARFVGRSDEREREIHQHNDNKPTCGCRDCRMQHSNSNPVRHAQMLRVRQYCVYTGARYTGEQLCGSGRTIEWSCKAHMRRAPILGTWLYVQHTTIFRPYVA